MAQAEASRAARPPRDYTTGNLNKNIWLLAVPMVMEMGLVSLFRVADMFWVGKLGPESLAAITIGENIRWALSGLAMGQGIGGLAVVARRIGERDEEGTSHAALSLVGSQWLGFLLQLGILFTGRARIRLDPRHLRIDPHLWFRRGRWKHREV